jgi:pimeloyl-ACP methyl ester carboxylesterase
MNSFLLPGGARLGFQDSGAGLPVVFLHPTPLDRSFWLPLAHQLAAVRAIAPDLRGHGLSELGTLPVGNFSLVPDAPALTMRQMAADILTLLDHLEIETAVFAGCSLGGYVLLELWRQAPQRIRAAAFICSKPQPDNEAGIAKRAANIAQLRAEGTQPLFDMWSHLLVGPTAREHSPEVVGAVRTLMTQTAREAEAVQAGLAIRPDSIPTVATIGVPVLAIAGGEDPASTPVEMEAFLAAPGGCEYHLLPGVGHFAAYTQPQKVSALMAQWLRQLDA